MRNILASLLAILLFSSLAVTVAGKEMRIRNQANMHTHVLASEHALGTASNEIITYVQHHPGTSARLLSSSLLAQIYHGKKVNSFGQKLSAEIWPPKNVVGDVHLIVWWAGLPDFSRFGEPNLQKLSATEAEKLSELYAEDASADALRWMLSEGIHPGVISSGFFKFEDGLETAVAPSSHLYMPGVYRSAPVLNYDCSASTPLTINAFQHGPFFGSNPLTFSVYWGLSGSKINGEVCDINGRRATPFWSGSMPETIIPGETRHYTLSCDTVCSGLVSSTLIVTAPVQ